MDSNTLLPEAMALALSVLVFVKSMTLEVNYDKGDFQIERALFFVGATLQALEHHLKCSNANASRYLLPWPLISTCCSSNPLTITPDPGDSRCQ
jgi:hypothetical protein